MFLNKLFSSFLFDSTFENINKTNFLLFPIPSCFFFYTGFFNKEKIKTVLEKQLAIPIKKFDRSVAAATA